MSDKLESQRITARISQKEKDTFIKKAGGQRGDASFVLQKLVKAYNRDQIIFK